MVDGRKLFAIVSAHLVGAVLVVCLSGILCRTSPCFAQSSSDLRRETRQHNFRVSPSHITISETQKLRFRFADSHGNSVAVRWKFGSPDCSADSCGVIEADGTYTAPKVLSHATLVMLEAIPMSDPEHSVWAEIRLVPRPSSVRISQTLETKEGSSACNVQESCQVHTSTLLAVALTRPIVTYQDHQLSVSAQNQTFADVLRIIAEKIGANIEIPAGTGLERIAEQAGPAPPKDVLEELLNGSHFNFVIMSDPDTEEIQQVLLSSRDDSAIASPEITTPVIEPPSSEASDPAAPVDASTPTASAGSPVPADVLGEMMRAKAREIREAQQEQQQQQQPQDQPQPTSQPKAPQQDQQQ